MAERFQLAPQCRRIVDLAVVDDAELFVGRGHRLLARGRQVQDGQSRMSQARLLGAQPPLPEPRTIWAAMSDQRQCLGEPLLVQANRSHDAAHTVSLFAVDLPVLLDCSSSVAGSSSIPEILGRGASRNATASTAELNAKR